MDATTPRIPSLPELHERRARLEAASPLTNPVEALRAELQERGFSPAQLTTVWDALHATGTTICHRWP